MLIEHREDDPADRLAGLRCLLDRGELARLEQYRRPGDQTRFLLGRGTLRLLLGHFMGRDPASLSFAQGPHGKPFLLAEGERQGGDELLRPPAAGAEPLQFNVSHSGDLILLGFHATRPVGVDVERHRPGLAWRPLAERVLPPLPRQRLDSLPTAMQAGAFLQEWCLLEATLKARGTGLAGVPWAATGRGPALPAPEASPSPVWGVRLPSGYAGAAALA